MLGVLHKVNLGTAPAQLQLLLGKVGTVHEPPGRQHLRYWRPLHDKQLATPASWESTDVLQRSLFGLAHCYNALPQLVVDSPSVKSLQHKLQGALLTLAEKVGSDWSRLFAGNWRGFPRAHLDVLFGPCY